MKCTIKFKKMILSKCSFQLLKKTVHCKISRSTLTLSVKFSKWNLQKENQQIAVFKGH